MKYLFNNLISLFRLSARQSTIVLVLTCALCVTGCASSDRAITFNNAKASDQNGQSAAGAAVSEGVQSGLSAEMTISDDIRISTDANEICVYVCGEVNYPGVYFLAEESRANDALFAAGGFTEEADQSYVNLASRVKDGDRLYFPGKSETAQEKAAEEALKAGLVDINTADEALLCTLPGIGSSRAKDIISYRESNGPFESKEDIMKVSGIKDSAYQKLCDRITVGKE